MSEDTIEKPAVDSGTFEGSISSAITGSAEVAAEASPAAAPVTVVEMSVAQIQVLFAEIRAIGRHAHRLTVLSSDYASALHPKIDEAIQTANVSKDLLESVRDRLVISQESSLVAILVDNILTRLEPSTTDLYRVKQAEVV